MAGIISTAMAAASPSRMRSTSPRTCAVEAFAPSRGRVALSAKVTPAAALVALDVQDVLDDAVALRFSRKGQLRNAAPCHVDDDRDGFYEDGHNDDAPACCGKRRRSR